MSFPSSLAPIIPNRLIRVLVDAELGTYNIDINQLEAALANHLIPIQAFQSAVVTFVQTPVRVDGDPEPIQFLDHGGPDPHGH